MCRFQWVLLLLAAPFFLFPTPGRSLALLVVPVLWLATWLVTRRPLPRTPLNLPILLVLIMVLVSLYATFDLAFSLSKIAGMVLGVGMYFAFIQAAAVEEDGQDKRASTGLRIGIVLFLAGGLGVAGLGLLGTRWFSKFEFLQPLIKRLPFLIQGLPGADAGFHPNEVAGALLWVLPFWLAILVWVFLHLKQSSGYIGRGWTVTASLALLLAAGFTGGVFILTQSRSGLIGLFGSLVLVPAMLFPKGRLRLAYLVCLALLVAGLGLAAWRLGWVQQLYTDTSTGAGTATTLFTLNGRVDVWRRAIFGIQDFPITGMGMNSFRKVVNVFYPFYTTIPNFDIGHAHNEFLQAALDLGLPGLVGFITLYLVSFWMLWQTWHTTHRVDQGPGNQVQTGKSKGLEGFLMEPAGVKVLVLGLGGSLLAHAIYGMTDAVTLGAKPGILFWMLLGLVSNLYFLQRSNVEGKEGLDRR
jgi:putative inorganic carbon (hco3(-)) transporter